MKPSKTNKGQNVIEYVLLVTAVVSVCFLFLNLQGRFKNSLEKGILEGTVKQVEGARSQIRLK